MGPKDYLEREGLLAFENVSFVRVEKNQGPAAGFTALFQHCYAEGCDWLWVMDDDVIPEPNALEELVSAYTTNFSTPESIGFLASYLRTPDGQPNNVPDVDNRQEGFAPPRWAELLGQGLVRVKFSTLCADFIPRSTMERFGFPCADFYYGGEDIDYTLRIARERPVYLVGKSNALHLRAVTGKFHILAETDPKRIPFYYYYYRNQLYLRRAYLGRHSLVRFLDPRHTRRVPRSASRQNWSIDVGHCTSRSCCGYVFPPVAFDTTVAPARHDQTDKTKRNCKVAGLIGLWPTRLAHHLQSCLSASRRKVARRKRPGAQTR